MIKASLKSLWARKVALLLSTIAIVLGTAFVGGTFTFTDMLDTAFKGIVGGSVADVNVEPKGALDNVNATPARTLSALKRADIDKLKSVDGVAAAYGTVGAQDAFLLGKDGKPLTQNAPGIGSNYLDAPTAGGLEGLVMKSGHKPEGPDQVVIDPESLKKLGANLGDPVKIYTSGSQGVVTKTIVGTALYGSKGSTGGASYAIFDTPTAQKLFMEGDDGYQGAWIVTKKGVDPKDVAARVGPALPEHWEAKTGEEVSKTINDVVSSQLSFITYLLLAFAGIALLVGSFLIVNTFTILVAQRARELALFRAMGAGRGQVRGSVIVEALALGLVGSTVGLGVGFGLAFAISKLFGGMGLDISGTPMRLTPMAVVATYAVGLLVTLVAALVPAVRASRVPPVAAMSGDFVTGKSGLGWRAVLGGLLTVAGAAALVWGLFGSFDETAPRMWTIGAGALVTVLGVASISPILGAPVIAAIGAIGQAMFGATGRLAELNSRRNPRRTASTASALMIGLAIVTAFGVVASSTAASTDKILSDNLRADFVMQDMMTGQPFSTAIGDQIEKIDGVAAVHRMRFAPAKVDGDNRNLAAMAPGSFDKILKQDMVSGSIGDFRQGTALVRDDYAKDHGVTVGRTLSAVIAEKPVDLKVVGVYSMPKGTGFSSVLTTLDTLDEAGLRQMDGTLSVVVRQGADKAGVKKQIDDILAPVPMVKASDQKEFAEAQNQQTTMILYMLYALLGLAIVIAVFGVVNTLGLSIVERTREIGLLRAVGFDKGQVRRMIMLESSSIALLGAALGIGLGLVFGLALQRSLAGVGLTELALPWPQLAISVVTALIVGVLAGLWPAVRATNIDVLKAIATT